MHRSTFALATLVAMAACSKPADKTPQPADSTAAPAAAAAPAPPAHQAIVTVIYKWPKSPAAFEKYYPTHLKIVGDGQAEIGFVRADLTKFDSNVDGSAPAEYRQAELCFPTMDALKKGIATPAFKKVGDDPTLRLQVSYEEMLRVIQDLVSQLSEEERMHYLVESLFLNSVTYENERAEAYLRKLGAGAPKKARARSARR